jgi:membrane protease YdiL (CAAX protease family)
MSDPIHNDSYDDYDFPEEERSYSKHIAPRRFYVFLEVFMAMLINFLIYQVGYNYLDEYIPESNYKELISYAANLISTAISILIALGFIKVVFYRNKMPLKEAAPPYKETSSLFTFKNFGMQIFYSMLILFFVYIPLDFISYSIPGSLEFTRKSFSETTYINFTNFGFFILFALLMHLMVGIREEFFFRGFTTIRSEKYLITGSSVVISSMYFALSHFTYIFYSTDVLHDLIPSLIWTLGAFYVGSVSAVFILKKRRIWPIILAHFLNNVISITVLWLNTTHGIYFWDIAKWLYSPLLGVSLILFILFFREVKTGIKSYFSVFHSYRDNIPDKNTRAKIIAADIIFGLLFWAAGMFTI